MVSRKNPISQLNEKLKKDLKGKNFSGLNLEEYLEPGGFCFKFAKEAKIERTQLRKYFDEIKQIKALIKGKEGDDLEYKIRIKLAALIPKFAYAKGRRLIEKDVYEFFSLVLKEVKGGKVKDFNTFEQILEAILAYHRYHHPKS